MKQKQAELLDLLTMSSDRIALYTAFEACVHESANTHGLRAFGQAFSNRAEWMAYRMVIARPSPLLFLVSFELMTKSNEWILLQTALSTHHRTAITLHKQDNYKVAIQQEVTSGLTEAMTKVDVHRSANLRKTPQNAA